MANIARKKTKQDGQHAKLPIPPIPTIANESTTGNTQPNTVNPNKNESHLSIEHIPPIRVRKDFVIITIQIILVLAAIASPVIVWWMTSEQNKITQKALNYARQNYIEENRPYVFPGTPTAKRSKHFKERLAHVPIINYGRTPAFIVLLGISYQKWSPVPDVRYENFPKNLDTLVLAPNSTYILDLPPYKRYWSKKDTCREFVVGKILYGDNWNNKLHFTSFAYKLISRYDSSFVLVYQSGDTNDQIQSKK